MSLNKGLAPDLVLSGLDEVFYSKFNEAPAPNYADVTSQMVFKQDSTDRSGIITEVVKDGGMWSERAELANLSEANISAGQKRTFTVAEFAQNLPISATFFEDEQYGAVKNSINKMALKGLLTKRREGFKLYRNAFTTALTNDGQPIISDTHTNLNGDIVDNKLTAALSEGTVDAMIQALLEQKDQSGDNVGFEPYCLFVPNRLYKKATEILESEWRSGTANNDLNVYSSKYGIYLLQSNWIGASNGGSDTACFLLAKDHSITRWLRKEITTELVEPKYSSNFVYQYKARYREVYGALTYEGIVGTDGSTAAL